MVALCAISALPKMIAFLLHLPNWNDYIFFVFGFSVLFHSCITNRFLSFSPGLLKMPIDVLIVLNQHKTSHLSSKKEFILLDCLGFLSNRFSLVFLALTPLQFIRKKFLRIDCTLVTFLPSIILRSVPLSPRPSPPSLFLSHSLGFFGNWHAEFQYCWVN